MTVSAPTHAPPATRGVLQRLCRNDVAHASRAARHHRRPCGPPPTPSPDRADRSAERDESSAIPVGGVAGGIGGSRSSPRGSSGVVDARPAARGRVQPRRRCTVRVARGPAAPASTMGCTPSAIRARRRRKAPGSRRPRLRCPARCCPIARPRRSGTFGPRRAPRIDVTTTRGGSRPPRASTCIETARLAGAEVTVHAGIPVTTVARTLADLAAVLRPPAISSGRSSARRRCRSSTSPSVLASVRSSPRGARWSGAILGAWEPSRTKSELEVALLAPRAPRARSRRPRSNARRRRVRGRPALAPRARSSPRPTASSSTSRARRWSATAARDAVLARAGYRVLRFTDRQVRRRPERGDRRAAAPRLGDRAAMSPLSELGSARSLGRRPRPLRERLRDHAEDGDEDQRARQGADHADRAGALRGVLVAEAAAGVEVAAGDRGELPLARA